MDLYNDCVADIKELVGNEYLYFETAVLVKTSPHCNPFKAWAVCVSSNNKLFVIDDNEEWFEVESTPQDQVVLNSLYQRLQSIKTNYGKFKSTNDGKHYTP